MIEFFDARKEGNNPGHDCSHALTTTRKREINRFALLLIGPEHFAESLQKDTGILPAINIFKI
jgi:hypothetical protein